MRKKWQTIKGVEVPIRCINYKFINGFCVPCGHCIHCRKRLAREWAFRCQNESLHKYGYNILLTYDDEHLSYHKGQLTVEKVHLQGFMKRLRFYLDKLYKVKVSFFAVGEYGGFNHRPHYHLILWSETNLHEGIIGDSMLSIIELTWKKGFVNFEILKNAASQTFYMCAYMLQYSDGRKYDKYNKPFRLMSRNPSIGRCWLDRNEDLISKMQAEMNYYIKQRNEENGQIYTLSLPRYYRRHVVPEEQQIMFADEYYEMCKDFQKLLKELSKRKIDYGKKRNDARRELAELQRKEYEQKKCHERCRAFSRHDRKA